ncbi:MAG: hypothetical protein HYY67_07315 [Thaumarchaeota archaeon]|nr:hypothetical protein [Nitrososphaerota archaeon]
MPKRKFPQALVLFAPSAPFLVLTGFLSVYLFYLVFTGHHELLSPALAFAGVPLIVISIRLLPYDRFAPKRFLAIHALLVGGYMLVLSSLKTGVPFTSVTSFEMGSFALIFTGFFLARKGEPYQNVLFFSATSTLFFFTAGIFLAHNEVLYVPSNISDGPNLVVVSNSLILVAMMDLLILGFQLYLILFENLLKLKKPQEGENP